MLRLLATLCMRLMVLWLLMQNAGDVDSSEEEDYDDDEGEEGDEEGGDAEDEAGDGEEEGEGVEKDTGCAEEPGGGDDGNRSDQSIGSRSCGGSESNISGSSEEGGEGGAEGDGKENEANGPARTKEGGDGEVQAGPVGDATELKAFPPDAPALVTGSRGVEDGGGCLIPSLISLLPHTVKGGPGDVSRAARWRVLLLILPPSPLLCPTRSQSRRGPGHPGGVSRGTRGISSTTRTSTAPAVTGSLRRSTAGSGSTG